MADVPRRLRIKFELDFDDVADQMRAFAAKLIRAADEIERQDRIAEEAARERA